MSTTAFVLPGGASHGAVQVGGLAALVEAGVAPDLVVGCSVGALNAGWLVGRADAAGVAALADLWRTMSRASVFPGDAVCGLLGLLGRRRHVLPNRGLRRILAEHLLFDRLEDAPVPLAVVATDVLDGHDVLLRAGDAVSAVLASAAIPGILPPVTVDGRDLMDGGVVNNTPVSHAVAMGADTVWVVPTTHCFAASAAPTSAVGMMLAALAFAVNHRLAADIERFAGLVDLRVVPPLCGITVSPADFGRADELITRAYAGTRRWLDAGRPGGAAVLLPHPAGPAGISHRPGTS